MTVKNFNDLSLNEKAQFINQELNGQSFGIYNTLVFKDKIITFLCAAQTGECIFADAIPNPDEYKNIVGKALTERNCINFIHDGHPLVKEKVFGAYQRCNNKMNKNARRKRSPGGNQGTEKRN